MIRTVLSACFFLTFALLCLSPRLAAADDIDKPVAIAGQYEEAKSYYNQLQSNGQLAQTRENWLKATRNFRRIYLSSPRAEQAPACLFMLGRVYSEMYDRFQNGIDLDESMSYYKDTAQLFPQHRLADDAYMALAKLARDKRGAPQEASGYLTEIVNNHRSGDRYAEAENLLKALRQEHDLSPPPQVLASAAGQDRLSHVLPVKYWSSDNYTRVVVMASAPVDYEEILLEESENTPRRLYIDFKKSYIEPQYRAPVPIEDGLLRQIRTGQFSPDTVRVVLDIDSIKSYKIYSLPEPYRVVIDVHGEKRSEKPPMNEPPAEPVEIAAEKTKIPTPAQKDIVVLRDNKKVSPAHKSAPEAARPEKSPESKPLTLAQQLGLGVKKIVLDPGHGGKDPGAMAFGMKEKDVVLKIARQLAPVLAKELGCEVLLTRQNDSFLSLEERTAIANTKSADLFVSLHINAHSSAKVRGLETYYLNLTSNADAMQVAARENATSTHQMSDLQDILSDIMKNSKVDESSRLAQQVHNSILSKAEKQGFADIKNLGVKQAPFYVLIGAQMPAILIELAFISNEQDSQNLNNPSFVKMLTQEITRGIRAYVNDTTAQLSKN